MNIGILVVGCNYVMFCNVVSDTYGNKPDKGSSDNSTKLYKLSLNIRKYVYICIHRNLAAFVQMSKYL